MFDVSSVSINLYQAPVIRKAREFMGRHPYACTLGVIGTIAGTAFYLHSLRQNEASAPLLTYKATIPVTKGGKGKNSPEVSPTEHCIPSVRESRVSLEMQFSAEVTQIDLARKPNFASYLAPNEGWVLKILPHLEKMDRRGLIVSTGTERSFFDLALCDPAKCEGLVVIDFDPEVKAYVDFNVLLLRISENVEHYAYLSTIIQNPAEFWEREKSWNEENYLEKMEKIKTLLIRSDSSLTLKEYYLTHLYEFGKIYFKARYTGPGYNDEGRPADWRQHIGFQDVAYHKKGDQFDQLQRYAKAGNIIAVVRDMSELSFLDSRNVALIDVSNIPDYSILNLKTRSSPVVVSTKLLYESGTEYNSHIYHPMTQQEIQEFDEALEILSKENPSQKRNPSVMPHYVINGCPVFYFKETLDALKNYINKYFVKIDGEWICCHKFSSELANWMKIFPKSQIPNLHLKCNDTHRLAQFLVKSWRFASPEDYLAFSKVPGWAEAFRAERELGDSSFLQKFGNFSITD